jgi:hypothetical protein
VPIAAAEVLLHTFCGIIADELESSTRALILLPVWFLITANLSQGRDAKPPVRGTDVLDSGVAQYRRPHYV